MGVDLACYPDSSVYAMNYGTVTKLGYPYGDDLSYRYVEITTGGVKERYFYVFPLVSEDDTVYAGQLIGVVQDLSPRYPGITNHIHFEVKLDDDDGDFINPEEYLRN